MSDLSTATTQITQMLTMQDAMNSRVSDTWKNNNYEWYRAIWVECAEMLDHHGWKWWKAQTLDLPQVQMELVDVWHFALSHMIIQHHGDINKAASDIEAALKTSDPLIEFDGITFDFSKNNLVENAMHH